MKNLLLIMLFALAATGCTLAQGPWQTVGALQNGEAVLTADKAELLQAYNQNLRLSSQIEGSFTEVNIVPRAQGTYALVFEGEEYKSTFGVKIAEDGSSLQVNNKISCTTIDCAAETSGCEPRYNDEGQGYCSPCSNEGECFKTVSNKSLLNSND